MYVHLDDHGKGISELLLQLLVNRAREMHRHAVIAAMDGKNMISYQLHHSFGFIDVAHFKEVGFKYGRWLDLKFMELILH